MSELKRPGARFESRALHFILIADCSGSMAINGKIQRLNFAVKEALPAMRTAAGNHPEVRVLVRVVKFATGATWHVADPVPVQQFEWADLEADEGVTDMGQALSLVARSFAQRSNERQIPPVVVLISDGAPTDNFAAGLRELMAQPLGQKAVRIAIAIGDDAKLEPLQEFIGHPGLAPLQVRNSAQLIKAIKWATTTVVGSTVKSQVKPSAAAAPLPPPPQLDAAAPSFDAEDEWIDLQR